jgi:hypothetical protein
MSRPAGDPTESALVRANPLCLGKGDQPSASFSQEIKGQQTAQGLPNDLASGTPDVARDAIEELSKPGIEPKGKDSGLHGLQ